MKSVYLQGMTTTANLIVLNFTKFGENSIVIHTISKEYGRRGFLVRVGKPGNGQSNMSLFLPLNILEADIVENPKAQLWTARNIVATHPLIGIRNNMYKNTMTLFMSEVLYRTIKEGTNETGLYDWCVRDIMTLDAIENNFSNFHIYFLLELSGVLGFRPSFEDIIPFAGSNADLMKVDEGYLSVLRRFLSSSLSESMLIPLKGEDRNAIAEDLVKYLEFHTESRINIQSLKVLREIFQ